MFCNWRGAPPLSPPPAPFAPPWRRTLPRSGPFPARLGRRAGPLAGGEAVLGARTADLPGPFANLSYDAYTAIQAKPEGLIWADDTSAFVIEPLHRGFIFTSPMQIFLVEDGLSRRLNYDASKFVFGGVNLPAAPTKLDFSGFRVLKRDDQGEFQELAIFQGASFFRSRRRARPSASPRAACRSAPAIRAARNFRSSAWSGSKRPSRAANAMTISALLESESVVGAYRFTIHPGDATIIDVECSLFPAPRSTITASPP